MVSRQHLGFSLMEMLVATAILLVAIGVLSELADVGRRHASGAEEIAAAQRICQNVLDELLCGAMPLEPTSESVVLDEPDWTFSVDIEPIEQFEWDPALAKLRVTVVKMSEGVKPGKPFSLTRWIRYPSTTRKAEESAGRSGVMSEGRPISGGPAS